MSDQVFNRLFYSFMNCHKSQMLHSLRRKIPVEWLFYRAYEHPDSVYKEIVISGKNGWSYPWDIQVNDESLGIKEETQMYEDFISAKPALIKLLETNDEVYIWTRNKYIPHMELTQSDPNGVHSLTLTSYDKDIFQIVDYPFERSYSSEIIQIAFDDTPHDKKTVSNISLSDFQLNNIATLKIKNDFKDLVKEISTQFAAYDQLTANLHQNDSYATMSRLVQFFGVISLSRTLISSYMRSNNYSNESIYRISEISRSAESLKNYFIKTMQAPHRMDIDAVNIKCSTLRDLELAFLQMLKKEIFEGVVLTNNNKTLDSVTNLNVIHRTDTSIWISWTDKLKESQLVKYEIYLNGKIVDTCSSEQCIIGDLDSNTTYEIAVITKGLFDLMSEKTIVFATTLEKSSEMNLALYKRVYASSNEDDEFSCFHIVDGRSDTRWSSGYSDAEWVVVDLGKDTCFSKIILRWEGAYASEYQIQCSKEASSWDILQHVIGGKEGVYELNNLHACARYIRVYCMKRGTIFGYSLWEISVYNAENDSELGVCHEQTMGGP